MGCIFLLGETSFNQGETSLHEHDKESRDQGPHNVYPNLVMTVCCTNSLHRRRQFAYVGANGGNGSVLGFDNAIKDFYCHCINVTERTCFSTRRVLRHQWHCHEKAYNNS